MAGAPASNESAQRRGIRLAFGVTIAFMVHLMDPWPLSHLMPVAVVVLLMDAAPMSLRTGLRTYGLCVLLFISGGIVTWLLSPWPVVLLLVCIYMFYRILAYVLTMQEHLLVFVSVLVGFTVIPIVMVLWADLGFIASAAMMTNWGVAMLIAPVAWLVVPLRAAPPEDHHGETIDAETARELAVTMTIVLGPLLAFFLIFSSTKILVMVYSILFAMSLGSYEGRKMGFKYIIANAVYGCLGMLIIYELLVMVPEISFAFPLMFVALYIYASRIFLGGPTGAFWSSGIFGFLIMLGGILVKDDIVAASTLMARLWQIILATAYVTFAWSVVEYGRHLKKKWWPAPVKRKGI